VGSVERATRARLGKLRGVDTAVKACAIALARQMDENPSAAVAREHRLTVQSLVVDAWERAPQQAAPEEVDESPEDDLARVIGRIERGGAA
jgi:spore germination cell wall hydrolase CwlJ-like protein